MPASSSRSGQGLCGNAPICSPSATDDYSFFRAKQQRDTYYTRSTSSVLSRMNNFQLARKPYWRMVALFMLPKPSMTPRDVPSCGDGYKKNAVSPSASKLDGQVFYRYPSFYLFPQKID